MPGKIESGIEMVEDNNLIINSHFRALNHPDAAKITAGMQLAKYTVVRMLGRGGMGEVYEVRHQTLEKSYAIKVLPQAFADSEDALQRFEDEARVMANLDHPNITRVDDFRFSDGVYWLRMELAQGDACGSVSLQDMADRNNGRIDPRRLHKLMLGVLNGVAWAHDKGIMHRNLKPANLLLFMDIDGELKAKVSDFGLVRILGEDYLRSRAMVSANVSVGPEGSVAESSSRALISTWEYMAPEQQDGKTVDVRADVYSLGLVFYRLLTGEPLSPRAPSKIIPGLGNRWDSFVLKALEINPDERFQNAREMLEALNAVAPAPVSIPKVPAALPVEEEKKGWDIIAKAFGYLGKKISRTGFGIIKLLLVIALSVWILQLATDGLVWLAVSPILERNDEKEEITKGLLRLADRSLDADEKDRILEDLKAGYGNWERDAGTRSIPTVEENAVPVDANEEIMTGSLTRVLIDADKYIDFVYIGPGSFRISEEDSGKKGYKPEIFVSKFWMAKTEISQGIYKAVTGRNPSAFKDDGRPVESITWYDANEFCWLLSSRLSIICSLPSDAQWERACSCFSVDDANRSGKNSRYGSRVLNMQESVREWCRDWYASDGLSSGSTTDPAGPRMGISRVVRGDPGTHQEKGGFCTARKGVDPESIDRTLGFRIVISTDPDQAKEGALKSSTVDPP